MARDQNPLVFVSALIALSVKPFDAASKWSFTYFQDEHRQLTPLLLYPAMLLALPFSLLICILVVGYVFFVLPLVMIYQAVQGLFPPSPPRDVVGHTEPSGRE